MPLWFWILGAAGGIYLLTKSSSSGLTTSEMQAKIVQYFAANYQFSPSHLQVRLADSGEAGLAQVLNDENIAALAVAPSITALYNYVMSGKFPRQATSHLTALYYGPFVVIDKSGNATQVAQSEFTG